MALSVINLLVNFNLWPKRLALIVGRAIMLFFSLVDRCLACDGNCPKLGTNLIGWCLAIREWTEGGQLWVQQVSSTPATRLDVIGLQEELDRRLQQRQARETGICPVRRELYSQCFGKSNSQFIVTFYYHRVCLCANDHWLTFDVCNGNIDLFICSFIGVVQGGL